MPPALSTPVRAPRRQLDEFARERFDYVIPLCDRVREVCPEFPGHAESIHCSIPDPAREPDGYPAFQRTAAELSERIGFLRYRIAADIAATSNAADSNTEES